LEQRVNVYRLLQQGKPQEALLLAEAIYEAEPSPDTITDYVHLLVQQRFFERAENVLQLSGISPAGSQNIYLLYVDLYSATGRTDELCCLKEYVGHSTEFDDTDIGVTSSSHTALAPDQSYFANQLCQLALEFHNICPGFEEVGQAVAAQIKEGQLEDAVRRLRAFSDGLVDNNLRYYLRAEINLLEGDYRRAEKRFMKLIDVFTLPALVRNRLGDICLATGRRQEAKHHYNEAARIDPSDIDTFRDLIRTYLLNAELTAAKKVYIQARDRFGAESVADLRTQLSQVGSNLIATINGLAWYEGGGGILPIEIDISAGAGQLHPSGNIGLTMMDSLHLAHRCAYNRATSLGIPADRKDIAVNVPEAPVFKDGPSAGLAFTIGILSKLLDRPIPFGQAFTGEISLSGNIHRVGGIPGKLGAAYFADLDQVYVPATNLPDVFNVSRRVKSALSISVCSRVDDVVEALWPS